MWWCCPVNDDGGGGWWMMGGTCVMYVMYLGWAPLKWHEITPYPKNVTGEEIILPCIYSPSTTHGLYIFVLYFAIYMMGWFFLQCCFVFVFQSVGFEKYSPRRSSGREQQLNSHYTHNRDDIINLSQWMGSFNWPVSRCSDPHNLPLIIGQWARQPGQAKGPTHHTNHTFAFMPMLSSPPRHRTNRILFNDNNKQQLWTDTLPLPFL